MNAPQQHQPSTDLAVPGTQLMPFAYGDQQVRVIERDGAPWFVAADVCAVLSIARVHDAVRGLDHDEKGADTIRTPGGDQQVTVINEPGLYSLLLRSRKAEAKEFKRWITHDVIPAIRRTGSYSAAAVPAPRSSLDVLRAALDEIEAVQQQAERAEARAIAAEQQSADTGARLDAIEGRHDWYAGLGYARIKGWPTDRLWLQRLGKRAAQIGRAANLPESKVQHGLYGQVNQWPGWCWDQAHDELGEIA